MRSCFGLVIACAAALATIAVWPAGASAQNALRREAVLEAMRPYDGATYEGPAQNVVDRSTAVGKVLCGYQGWFTTPSDGAGRGWRHYTARRSFEPGSCSIDLWPDVSELDEDERVPTDFRHADGRVAHVFSSHNRKTVLRHFAWMREYGLDGAFVQRFAVETVQPLDLRHCNTVLAHCREGANLHGRTYAVMYDLSGLPADGIRHVIEDWKQLVDRMRIGNDPADKAYLRHRGRPLVAVWGIGFNDGRKYSLADCERLVNFLKFDALYGGNSVMIGVPTGWRTLDADSVTDPLLHKIAARADIVSPWTVGRYRTLEEVTRHAERRWKPDVAWCAERKVDYLPVVFPGFSWHNLRPESPTDQIPRQGGRFLWQQYAAARGAGATMVYQAMFDELDEGTAIFKCDPHPPVGASPFVPWGDLPSDHYLWLTGQAARLIRGELPANAPIPQR